jgi:sugar/nucleoside kinase (ribokinase family)/ribosomal protein S18 acetylase RimI-like enzyme
MFLVIGTTTLDLFNGGIAQMPTVRGDEFTTDSLVFCQEPLQMLLGGNAGIAAYALARLGAPVAIGSAIGNDPSGDLLQSWLQAAGVETSGLLRHPTAATSTTTVVSDQSRNRLAFHHAGSSHHYAPGDLPDALLARTKVVLLSAFTLLNQWRPHGFVDLLVKAKKQGVITALDIGPAIGQPVKLEEIADLLQYVDYFICNEHELGVCCEVDETAGGSNLGMVQVLTHGAGCVVIKRGAEGALVQIKGGATVHVSGFAVNARMTVGAGDSFNAGFLYAVQQGKPPAVAARFANAVAALVVTSAQGALGAPTLSQVEALITKEPAPLVDRIQAQLRASAHQNYEAVAAPPFTCFINPDDPSPWSNYAIPDTSIIGAVEETLSALPAIFGKHGRTPRFEFIEEYAPYLAPLLQAHGFQEEMRALLMVCTPDTYQSVAPIPDVTMTELTATAPLTAMQEFLTVQRRSFGDDNATAVNETEAQQFRQRFQTTRLFAAAVDGRMVSAACLQPAHNGVTEIAGIATLRAFRRQGIGTLLTAAAVQAAFAQDIDLVFLTAGSPEAGRVYERAGFRTIGSGLIYGWPTIKAQA